MKSKCKTCIRYIGPIDSSIPEDSVKKYRLELSLTRKKDKPCLGKDVECKSYTPQIIYCKHCGKKLSRDRSVGEFCSTLHKSQYKTELGKMLKDIKKDYKKASTDIEKDLLNSYQKLREMEISSIQCFNLDY